MNEFLSLALSPSKEELIVRIWSLKPERIFFFKIKNILVSSFLTS